MNTKKSLAEKRRKIIESYRKRIANLRAKRIASAQRILARTI